MTNVSIVGPDGGEVIELADGTPPAQAAADVMSRYATTAATDFA